MRRKSVWKQRTIAYLAAASLAVGMIPASLPAADVYAEETGAEEIAVSDDVQQTDEQAPDSVQDVGEQFDDLILAPEQATSGDWYDYAWGEAETINPGEKITIENWDKKDEDNKPLKETGPKILTYNNSPYIQNFDFTIYDVTSYGGPTALFATLDTNSGSTYKFTFDYIARYHKDTSWELYQNTPEQNTFDVYVYGGEVESTKRVNEEEVADDEYGNVVGMQKNAKDRIGNELDEIKKHSTKIGTFLGNYQDWSGAELSFEAGGSKTTVLFISHDDDPHGALVANMKYVQHNAAPDNSANAIATDNLVINGACDADKEGWRPIDENGKVTYTESGNGNANEKNTAIELKNEVCAGVSQYLTNLLGAGDQIRYAFDITGIAEGSDTVEVYLRGGDLEEDVLLTAVKAEEGKWQTVSGQYNIESETPERYELVLKVKEDSNESGNESGNEGAVIDNVSVGFIKRGNDDDLSKLRTQAIAIIRGQDTLTDENKNDYENEIVNALTADEILNTLETAAIEAIDNKGASATQTVDDDSYEDKDGLKGSIQDVVTETENKITSPDEAPDQEKVQAIGDALEKGKQDIDNLFIKADAKAEIDKEVQEAKNEIEALEKLTDKEKEEVKAEIDEAAGKSKEDIDAGNTEDEIDQAKVKGIDAIKNLVKNAQNGVADPTPDNDLEKVKENGKDTVDKMDNLFKEEKDKYKDAIDEADSEDAVKQILKNAAKDEIAKAAEKAKDDIDNLPENLTSEEKEKLKKDIGNVAKAAKEAIEKSNTVDEIDKAVKKGVEDIENLADLSKLKDAAIAIVNKQDDDTLLNDKDDYKNAILDAADEKGVLDALKEAATTAIENKDENAKTQVDEGNYRQKKTLKEEITKVADSTEAAIKSLTGADALDNVIKIGKALEDGKQEIDKLLTDADKQMASDVIDKMENLDNGTKDEQKNQIDNADDPEDIIKALKDAAKKELEAKADKANEEIDKLGNIDAQKKEQYKKEVDKVKEDAQNKVDGVKEATDTETVNKILEELSNGKDAIDKAADAAKKAAGAQTSVDKNKEDAKDSIDGMNNLEDKDKEEAKDKIDEAADKEDNEAIREAYKPAAQKEIEEAAKKAKDEIDKLDLTKDEKDNLEVDIDTVVDDAKNAIKESDTVDEIDDAVKKGVDDINKLIKDVAKKDIDKAADKAKKDVDTLPNLTQAEKDKVKTDIDKAAEDVKKNIDDGDTQEKITKTKDDGVKAINDLVDEAKKKGADTAPDASKDLDNIKKDGKDTVDKMDNLSKEEKDKYKDDIDKADSEDKVNRVVKDAAQKDLDNLAKDAKDQIDKLDFLTDAEKKDMKDQVDKAVADIKKNIDAAKNTDELKKAIEGGKATINIVVNLVVNLTKNLTTEEKNIWKNSQSLDSVEQAILSTNTDKKDSKGSTFSKLRLRGIGKNKAIQLKWKKQTNADGYIIYGSRCGEKMKKLKTVTSGKTTTWTHKKLKKGTYYKYKIVAYKTIAGQQRVIAHSIGVHSITNGGKYLNPTKVTVSTKKNITLKKGKTTKIKATYNNKKKVKNHIRVLRFESSNTSVATVTNKGKVKAKKAGKCTIFVYLQNGYYTTVKVNVKK